MNNRRIDAAIAGYQFFLREYALPYPYDSEAAALREALRTEQSIQIQVWAEERLQLTSIRFDFYHTGLPTCRALDGYGQTILGLSRTLNLTLKRFLIEQYQFTGDELMAMFGAFTNILEERRIPLSRLNLEFGIRLVAALNQGEELDTERQFRPLRVKFFHLDNDRRICHGLNAEGEIDYALTAELNTLFRAAVEF